jgi:hypothetical protein
MTARRGTVASDIERVAAQLAAALRSGNSQHSESALRQYDELGVDESEIDLNLEPAKRVLTPEEAEDNSEVGGGTEADQEAAVANASDATPATTTINASDEPTLDEIAEPVDSDVEEKQEKQA